jgi:hypothetical protein
VIREILDKVNNSLLAGRLERPPIAQMVQAGRAVRSGASGGSTIVWAQIVQSLLYADPASFSLAAGRGYYNVRLVGDGTPTYNPTDHYALNATCIDDDNLKYQSILVDLPVSPATATYQTGHKPSTSPTYWEQIDDIRIEYALGYDYPILGVTPDMRLFVPWFPVNTIVPVITKVVDSVTRYYINLGMTYGGTDAQSSLRWNQIDGRAMACYK